MKKIAFLLLAATFAISAPAQKLSKEERAAAAKAAYEAAVESVKAKTFVLVPSSYTQPDGMIENNIDNSVFLSSEGEKMFAQGMIVCGNNYTNIMDATEYNPVFDKKGNLKLRITVMGRMLKGTYVISMRANTNLADVIFTPQSGGSTRKFSGPVVPLKDAKYNKRANPM